MIHELAEKAWVDTCADYRDVFLRERGVCEGARVFRCQVGVRRGKEGRPKARTECESVCKIEGCEGWVVRRLCGFGVHRRQHALSKLVGSVPRFGQYAC